MESNHIDTTGDQGIPIRTRGLAEENLVEGGTKPIAESNMSVKGNIEDTLMEIASEVALELAATCRYSNFHNWVAVNDMKQNGLTNDQIVAVYERWWDTPQTHGACVDQAYSTYLQLRRRLLECPGLAHFAETVELLAGSYCSQSGKPTDPATTKPQHLLTALRTDTGMLVIDLSFHPDAFWVRPNEPFQIRPRHRMEDIHVMTFHYGPEHSIDKLSALYYCDRYLESPGGTKHNSGERRVCNHELGDIMSFKLTSYKEAVEKIKIRLMTSKLLGENDDTPTRIPTTKDIFMDRFFIKENKPKWLPAVYTRKGWYCSYSRLRFDFRTGTIGLLIPTPVWNLQRGHFQGEIARMDLREIGPKHDKAYTMIRLRANTRLEPTTALERYKFFGSLCEAMDLPKVQYDFVMEKFFAHFNLSRFGFPLNPKSSGKRKRSDGPEDNAQPETKKTKKEPRKILGTKKAIVTKESTETAGTKTTNPEPSKTLQRKKTTPNTGSWEYQPESEVPSKRNEVAGGLGYSVNDASGRRRTRNSSGM
ncbi:hypothetical protein M011DRAFT_478822 [Sporormia fimetaria CBS 119925]|uniref:Uncharacterized protein n=1 Tax=Sporormia fimetaria CBS 119925 TaxID=1340428 RepID=A0A6A6V7J5_9PLEO|nr:hypothetical protein M011DRAFT_478822 [Sporormia fimetaria CBS 119925]